MATKLALIHVSHKTMRLRQTQLLLSLYLKTNVTIHNIDWSDYCYGVHTSRVPRILGHWKLIL